MTEIPLAEKVVRLHKSFVRAKIPHAFGGALALAYYATPRATMDIDVNVFLGPSEYPTVVAVLKRAGVGSFPDEAVALDRGQVRARWETAPIDIFFAYDDIHQSMQRNARIVPFGRIKIPIIAPEHLLVAKAVFNRTKDWIDIEQMLIAVDDLDLAEIRKWLEHLVGKTDARAVRVDKLITEVRGA